MCGNLPTHPRADLVAQLLREIVDLQFFLEVVLLLVLFQEAVSFRWQVVKLRVQLLSLLFSDGRGLENSGLDVLRDAFRVHAVRKTDR